MYLNIQKNRSLALGRKNPLNSFFEGLPVRVKFIVLHNAFFLVLGLALYFALGPSLNQIVKNSVAREQAIIVEIFRINPSDLRQIRAEGYTFQEGTADSLRIPLRARPWLLNHPTGVWKEPAQPGYYARFDKQTQLWQVITLDSHISQQVARRFHLRLAAALGIVYVLAVLVLELLVLPRYVYGPINDLLAADAALQAGDRERELIAPYLIPADERGQIMTSRNKTVTLLRRHERKLKETLRQLEEIASDLKRKNHLLETAKQNLASQDRLASLGILSAGVAHELNTPLAVLQGSLEKLAETASDGPLAERLQRMLRVTQRLRGISESLIDFARARTQTLAPVNIKPLLEEAWSLVRIEPKATGIVFSNQAKDSDQIMGNADRMLQVFVNLLKNAVDAVDGSGHVTVTTESLIQDQKNWVKINFDDDGPGIRPDILPVIFEPFVTSRLDARGTGLGLAVAEGIIYQHGGVIVAGNRTEGGARFEVTLPASPQELTNEPDTQ